MGMLEVAELVHHHVIEDSLCVEDQAPAEALAVIARAASSAARLIAHQHSGWLNAKSRSEVQDALREDLLGMLAVPLVNDTPNRVDGLHAGGDPDVKERILAYGPNHLLSSHG